MNRDGAARGLEMRAKRQHCRDQRRAEGRNEPTAGPLPRSRSPFALHGQGSPRLVPRIRPFEGDHLGGARSRKRQRVARRFTLGEREGEPSSFDLSRLSYF